MKMYSRLNRPDLICQLVAAGFLAGHAQDDAFTHQSPRGLLISQDGGVVENSAFDLDCGYGTGFILFLHIAVDLPAFAIWKWQLDLPWEAPQIQLLPDPLGSLPDEMYQVPGCTALKLPRNEVINHRRTLRRGHALDGLLLGFSFEAIPGSYDHGANIDATLVLIDRNGVPLLNTGSTLGQSNGKDRSESDEEDHERAAV